MASAQIPSLIRLYHTFPNGNKKLVFQNRVEQLAPAGGASEGAPASVSTPEKLINVVASEVWKNDDFIEVSVITDAAKVITAAKSIWSIPVITPQGPKTIGRAQFQNPALATTISVPATTEVFLGAYRVTEGQVTLGGKIYMDLQDNA